MNYTQILNTFKLVILLYFVKNKALIVQMTLY